MPTAWKDFHHLQNTRTLVTGGAGFIGSHLAAALVEAGSKVTVLDDLSGGGDPATLHPSITFIKDSILNPKALAQCMTECDFVFHQAALGSVPRSIEQPRLYHDVNITGTLNVLEAARHAKVKRIMFAASSSAYGDSPTLPKVETFAPKPLSPYAATKVACESLLAAYAASYGIDTVSLRYFNIFGPRQSPDNAYAAVIAAFAKALIAGHHPIIYGDGQQSRDFTYVDNVVLANLLATKPARNFAGAVINIATGQRITINELAKEMATLLNRPDLTPNHQPERPGDVKHSLADLTAAKTLLAYTPIVPFRDGLSTTMHWYQSKLKP